MSGALASSAGSRQPGLLRLRFTHEAGDNCLSSSCFWDVLQRDLRDVLQRVLHGSGGIGPGAGSNSAWVGSSSSGMSLTELGESRLGCAGLKSQTNQCQRIEPLSATGSCSQGAGRYGPGRQLLALCNMLYIMYLTYMMYHTSACDGKWRDRDRDSQLLHSPSQEE